MSSLWILAVPLGLHFLFEYLSKQDNRVGAALRASDEDAAQLAIDQRQREIAEIRKWMEER